MQKITVVDSIMGSGKTQWAIKKINSIDKCIYITPFLDEIDRITKQCKDVYSPTKNLIDSEGNYISKTIQLTTLVSMVVEKKKICITHELFQQLSLGMMELIKNNGFVLILDEVMKCVVDTKLSGQTISMMKGFNLISVEENGIVKWNDELFDSLPDNRNMFEFMKIRSWAKEGRLVLLGNKFYFWQFPISLFECFDEIYILTYLFKYQLMYYYFQKFNIEYEIKSIKKYNNEYELVEYYKPNVTQYNQLIDLYEPKNSKLDKVNADVMFSYTWYSCEDLQADIKQLRKEIRNYLNNVLRAKRNEVLWTCFKKNIEDLKMNPLNNSNFLPCNSRSTNKYSDKTKLFYLINKYFTPTIRNTYFKEQKINDEGYALSEMIQWIWRSAIRKNEKIHLFIASKRMRKILKKWLNEEL